MQGYSEVQTAKVAHQAAGVRLSHLDGLRGVAAFSVVLVHFLAAFAPALAFGSDFTSERSWQTLLSASPLFLFINGSFAVYIFMVLSGYVIAASCEHTRSSLVGLVAGRFVRLVLPSSAAVVVAICLFAAHTINLVAISEIYQHWWNKLLYKPDGFTWPAAAFDLLGGYLVTGQSYFVPPLWTMQVEFMGSCAIYLVFSIFGSSKFRLVAYLVMAVFTVAIVPADKAPLYLSFAAGAAMRDGRVANLTLNVWFAIFALLVGGFFGGMSQFMKPSETFYGSVLASSFEALRVHILYVWTVAAGLIVFAFVVHSPLQKLLAGAFGSFLGRISFAVYLLHFPILASLGVYFFLLIGRFSAFGFAATLAIYLTVVVLAAVIFERLVDRPAIRLSHNLRRWLRPMAQQASFRG